MADGFFLRTEAYDKLEDELRNARELRNVMSGHLADATARAERAEAAIQRATVIAKGWIKDGPDGAPRILAERILAALDSTETVEAAPADVEMEGPFPHLRGAYQRRQAPDAQRPEERSDEGPKKLPESCHSPEHCRPGHCEDPRWCIADVDGFDDPAPVDGEERK